MDHHRKILEDARGEGGRPSFSGKRREEGENGEEISHGSIRILRTDVTRLVVVEYLAEDATCLTHIMENQTRRRDIIFKSSREIAGSCDLAG